MFPFYSLWIVTCKRHYWDFPSLGSRTEGYPGKTLCLTDLWVVIFFKMQYPLSRVSSQISRSSVGCFAEELRVDGAVSSTTIKERITSPFFLQIAVCAGGDVDLLINVPPVGITCALLLGRISASPL